MLIQGIGFGGYPPLSTLIVEYLPTKWRNGGVMIWTTFWTFGFLLECVFASLFIEKSWRLCAFVSTLPLILGTVTTLIWDESPRFVALQGKHDEVRKLFTKVARVNKTADPFSDGVELQRHESCSSDSVDGCHEAAAVPQLAPPHRYIVPPVDRHECHVLRVHAALEHSAFRESRQVRNSSCDRAAATFLRFLRSSTSEMGLVVGRASC